MLTHLLLLPSSYILQPTPRPRCRGLIACAAAPMEPQPDLDVTGTIRAICDGLQKNDAPSTDAGVERLYNYLTPMGRVAIAPPASVPRGVNATREFSRSSVSYTFSTHRATCACQRSQT